MPNDQILLLSVRHLLFIQSLIHIYTYNGESGITTIPPFSRKKFQQQIKSYSYQYNKIYIVLSYDQGYEKNIKQYMDKHFQRTARKVFSSGLEVDVYQLRYNVFYTEINKITIA